MFNSNFHDLYIQIFTRRYESVSPSFLNSIFLVNKSPDVKTTFVPIPAHYLPPTPSRICEPQNRPIDCTLHWFSIVTIKYKWFDLEMNSELNIFD